MKKCCGVHTLRIAIGITILALLMVGGAGAKTITVNASGGGDYTKIQKAINASSNGDTILVYSGIYHENVNITKQLTLRGIDNPVVDAGEGLNLFGGSGSAITLSANGITLEGFTVTGAGDWGGDYPGAGINVTSSNNTLSGNNASNNWYSAGISLWYSSNNTMSGNVMTGNTYNFNLNGDTDSDFENYIDKTNLVDGKPVYFIKGATDIVYDSSTNAGIFYCISCVNVTLKNLDLKNNGYGIFFWNTTKSKIQNVNASNNRYGIYLSFSSNFNKLTVNNASNNWYGIYLSSSSNNTLSRNNASNNGDSGISLNSSSNNTLSRNNAFNNYCGGGSGIGLFFSSNNTLSRNNASDNCGGGISVSSSSNNTLGSNNAFNNGYYGIHLSSSNNNMMSGNMMTGNQRNFDLDGDNDSDFNNQIDTGNLVDQRPIYYIKKASDTTYDSSSNAGTFYCISCVNVTIKNLNLNKNSKGIYFWNTSQSRIQNVNASNNWDGISLLYSSNNTMSGNNANSNNNYGISLSSSSNNTLSGNDASNNGGYNAGYGIYLSSSSNNKLSGNNASNNGDNYMDYGSGISLFSSSDNTLGGNDASNNGDSGIFLDSSSNNTLTDNNVSNNNYGIHLSYSSNSTLSGNMMTGNQRNFDLDGDNDSDFNNQIDTGNLVDDRPVYYIVKASDTTYDSSSNAGTFYCISCVNVTIKNLNLNKNSKGIYFWNTSHSKIQNVNASNNWDGISLWYSSNNKLKDNNANSNGFYIRIGGNYYDNFGIGISLWHSSNNILTGNNASNNGDSGISLSSSSNNTLTGNNASNIHKGIFLFDSSNNTLTGNDASNNGDSGISLSNSSNNIFIDNNASNNGALGFSLSSSSNNTLTGNNALNNYFNFYGAGINLSSSSNNKLTGNNVSNNRNHWGVLGISLSSSNNNVMTGNIASKNWKGIYLEYSSNNTLTGNNVSNNIFGISVWYSGKNNTIYNNIFNNTNNFDFHKNKINAWNTTRQLGTNIIGGSFLGGNFWANPKGKGFSQTCTDVNGDGICDKSYILDANNIDYLPLARFTAPGITVVSPNGGETWSRGTTQIIRWNYSGTPSSRVNIELMKNGRKNRVITKNTSNDGAYNWSINSIQTLGADYKIKVKSTTNPSYTDKSNKNFIIDDFSVDINKKLILVGVDGFSLAKYKSMYPQLKNFSNIVNNGGWNGTLKITGHNITTTAPGNAELMTGLNESQNGVSSNKGSKIVDGKTIWERLEVYNSSIVTGSVYGKKTAYITTPLFDNAIPHIDWWQDRKTYGARIWPCGTSVDYDVDVANKATEFIKLYNKNSFFLVVYFASPDGSGHYCGGDTGQSYTDSFINVDKGLGILLNSLKDNGIDTTTQIIITGDHGWNLGTTGHGTVNNDTRILPLITNNITMLSNVTSNSLREQGEVAPTILDFFGMTTSDYQDITNEGYQSMRE